MYQDESLKIRLYLWTIIFFAAGTASGIYWDFTLGVGLWILGAVVGGHIVVVSVIRERRLFLEAERDRLEEQRKLYETVMKMDAESRYAFGLSYTPGQVTVKVDRTKEVGNEFSQIWRKLPVAPYKLKMIAQPAINGEGFTYRKWAGEDKVLSDDEWRALHKSMVDLGLLEPRGDDPRQGFSWTSLGEDVMIQIVKDTL